MRKDPTLSHGVRRGAAAGIVGVLVALLVPVVLVSPAFADSPDPTAGTMTGTAVTNPDGSHTLTIRGNWNWSRGCDDRIVGWEADWNDPNQAGNFLATVNGVSVDVGAAAANAFNPADNQVDLDLSDPCTPGGPGSTGTWGPISHTYGPTVKSADVCVVLYDTKGNEKTSGKHSRVAGGPDHNEDNSVEENFNTARSGCFTETFFFPAPAINIVKTGPATAVRLTAINYTLTVTNTGNEPLTNVVVTDNKCDAAPVRQSGDTNNNNILELTETWTYTCSHVATNTDPSPFVNVAIATGLGSGNKQVQDDDDHSVTLTPAPAPVINIDKTGPATATRGQSITYTLTVTNPGNISLNNVVVTDNKCDAAPVLQSKTGNGDNSLDVGEVWTYTCSRLTSNSDPSPFINLATATGTGTNGQTVTDTDDHSVTLEAAPLPTIRIEKSGPAEAQRGDTITYTLEVTIPSGTVPLTNVTVTDPVCDAAPSLQTKSGGDQDDTLEAGETWTYKCSHDVTNSDPNPLPNTAEATGTGPNNDQVTDEDSHLVDLIGNPDIRINKDGPSKAKVGDTITYILEVFTPVDRPLHDITVSDPKCDGQPKLQSKAGGDNDNILELGEVWVYTCEHKVTNADLGVLKNVAEVSGKDDDNDKVTDKDSSIVDVTEVEKKIIEKPPPVDEPLPFTGVDVTYPLLAAVGLMTAGTLSLILSGRETVPTRRRRRK